MFYKGFVNEFWEEFIECGNKIISDERNYLKEDLMKSEYFLVFCYELNEIFREYFSS